MARFRKVDPRLWSDSRFLALGDDARTIWLYLLTTPAHTAIPGIIIGGAAAHAEILRWSPERFREGFAELSAKGLANHDLEARLIWLPKAIKYNEPENPNVVVGWSKAWPEVPECALKQEVWRALKRYLEGSPKLSPERFPELFPEPFGHGSPNQEQEQEQDQEQEQEPEKEGEHEGGSPAARPPPAPPDGSLLGRPVEGPKRKGPKPQPSEEAYALADHLRELIVRKKESAGLSAHKLADARAWASTRTGWAGDLQKLLRTRDAVRARALLAWVFDGQDDVDAKYRIRVDSPRALDEKWDRVEDQIERTRATRPSVTVGHYKPTGEEEFSGGEVQL